MRRELFNEMYLSGFRSGKGQRAAGFAIDPVNCQQFNRAAVASIFTAGDQAGEALFEGWLQVAAFLSPFQIAGMTQRQHPGGLVDDHNLSVQMQNLHIFIAGWRRQRLGANFDHIVGHDTSAFIDAQNAVHGDPTTGQMFPRRRPRNIICQVAERTENRAGSFGCDNE